MVIVNGSGTSIYHFIALLLLISNTTNINN